MGITCRGFFIYWKKVLKVLNKVIILDMYFARCISCVKTNPG
jgi:hypothetical protein